MVPGRGQPGPGRVGRLSVGDGLGLLISCVQAQKKGRLLCGNEEAATSGNRKPASRVDRVAHSSAASQARGLEIGLRPSPECSPWLIACSAEPSGEGGPPAPNGKKPTRRPQEPKIGRSSRHASRSVAGKSKLDGAPAGADHGHARLTTASSDRLKTPTTTVAQTRLTSGVRPLSLASSEAIARPGGPRNASPGRGSAIVCCHLACENRASRALDRRFADGVDSAPIVSFRRNRRRR
jgi:hypothetical protein